MSAALIMAMMFQGGGSQPPIPQYEDEVTQYGFTWEFDAQYQVGQFINGDWWVVGPVTIVSITPAWTEDTDIPGIASRWRNGTMSNPVPIAPDFLMHGFDTHLWENKGAGGQWYDKDLNIADPLGIHGLPYTAQPGESLVSTKSFKNIQTTNGRQQIRKAAILTVVPNGKNGKFRPGYAGSTKVYHDEDDIDWSLLASLDPDPEMGGLGDMESWSTLSSYLQKPWIDFAQSHGAWASVMHPQQNMPEHSDVMARQINAVAVAVHTNFSNEEKEPALINLIQLGIDYYSVASNGGDELWPGSGAQSSGRKWPILFAGLMLDDQNMLALAADTNVLFGEDGTTFYVAWDDIDEDQIVDEEDGEVSGGFGGFCAADIGLPEWGTKHAFDPSDDRASWVTNVASVCWPFDTTTQNYRLSGTANTWFGAALACRIMGAESDWNHDAFFDYLDRYRCKVECEITLTRDDRLVSADAWVLELWDDYLMPDCCSIPGCGSHACP